MDVRIKSACGLQFKATPAEGIVEGYAATWDRDLGGDRYEKGAFAGVIARDLPHGRIKIYREHRAAVGLPVELKEDDAGLWVSGKIEPGDSVDGDETLNLAARGVYDSFSVAWRPAAGGVRFTKEAAGRTRVISEVERLGHIGILANPMNPGARIESVKGQQPLIDYEKKSLFALADALHHLAAVEEIRRWAELSDDEAAMARELLEHMADASEAIKARLPTNPADLAGLLEAARQLKSLAN